jgi:hypothetical protein
MITLKFYYTFIPLYISTYVKKWLACSSARKVDSQSLYYFRCDVTYIIYLPVKLYKQATYAFTPYASWIRSQWWGWINMSFKPCPNNAGINVLGASWLRKKENTKVSCSLKYADNLEVTGIKHKSTTLRMSMLNLQY